MVITTTAKATATSTTTTINYYNINVVADVVVQLHETGCPCPASSEFQ